MASDISTMALILKDGYGDYVRPFNDDCWIWDNALQADPADIFGLRAVHLVHTKRSAAVGARADGGALPTAHNETTKRVYIPMRRTYGRIQISRPLLKQAAGGDTSFVTELDFDMQSMRKNYGRDLCRQAWGTSNGVIAACASNSTVTVTLATTATLYQQRQCFGDGGMKVDIGTIANPTLRTSANLVTATGGSAGAYTITLTDAPGTSVDTNDYVFRSGAGGASDDSGNDNDGQKELTGLQTAISATAALHTLSVANGSGQWQSTVKSNSGTNRPVTEILLMAAALEASAKSGVTADAGACNEGVMLAIMQMLIAQKRHIVNVSDDNTSISLRAGVSGIMLDFPGVGSNGSGKLPIILDRDAPGNKFFGLRFDSIKKYVLSNPEWVDDDGAILRNVSGYDAFEAYIAGYQELGYLDRNTMFMVSDLTEATA